MGIELVKIQLRQANKKLESYPEITKYFGSVKFWRKRVKDLSKIIKDYEEQEKLKKETEEQEKLKN